VSATRPPTRSPQQEREADGLDDLEELGDDAIIAQQTEVHALRPRANVSEEARSVVITDHPQRRATEPPRALIPRPSGEATLVIRDRRALDEIRRNIARRQTVERRAGRSIYLWSALGLAAFVLGGIVAFLATDTASDAAKSSDDSAATGRSEASALGASAMGSRVSEPLLTGPPSAPSEMTRAVRLDDLPVEPKPKH
jgi:hypothetical protein